MLLLCDIAMIFMNFHTLLIIFGLTYLLSAPQCQFLFSAVFLFQVSPILKVLQKFQEKYRKNQRTGSFAKNQRWAREEPGEAQGGAWGPCSASGCPPSHIYPTRPETLEDRTLFRDLASVPPPQRFQDREHQVNSSRHPAGGENHHRELLHHHGRFPDES